MKKKRGNFKSTIFFTDGSPFLYFLSTTDLQSEDENRQWSEANVKNDTECGADDKNNKLCLKNPVDVQPQRHNELHLIILLISTWNILFCILCRRSLREIVWGG